VVSVLARHRRMEGDDCVSVEVATCAWCRGTALWLGVAIAAPAGASGMRGHGSWHGPYPPPNGTGTVIDAMSTAAYGSVLVVGGTGPLANVPLYDITSDANGMYGCTTTPEPTFEGTITCTGPESDFLNGVPTDEWPALTTTGHRWQGLASTATSSGLSGAGHR